MISSGVVLLALCDVLIDDCVSENGPQVVADLFIEKKVYVHMVLYCWNRVSLVLAKLK